MLLSKSVRINRVMADLICGAIWSIRQCEFRLSKNGRLKQSECSCLVVRSFTSCFMKQVSVVFEKKLIRVNEFINYRNWD